MAAVLGLAVIWSLSSCVGKRVCSPDYNRSDDRFIEEQYGKSARVKNSEYLLGVTKGREIAEADAREGEARFAVYGFAKDGCTLDRPLFLVGDGSDSFQLGMAHGYNDEISRLEAYEGYERAELHQAEGRLDAAVDEYVAIVEKCRRDFGDAHSETIWAIQALASARHWQGRDAEAEQLFVEGAELRRRISSADMYLKLQAADGQCALFMSQTRYLDAQSHCREAFELNRELFGSGHENTTYSIRALSWVYLQLRHFDEAEPLFVEIHETAKGLGGEEAFQTIDAKLSLGGLYTFQERFEDADALLVEAYEDLQRLNGSEHLMTQVARVFLGVLRQAQGRYADARSLYLEALAGHRRVLGDRDPQVGGTLYNLACLDGELGNRDEALDWLRQAVEAGYNDAHWMLHDADLEILHGPEFDELVARIRENAQEPH